MLCRSPGVVGSSFRGGQKQREPGPSSACCEHSRARHLGFRPRQSGATLTCAGVSGELQAGPSALEACHLQVPYCDCAAVHYGERPCKKMPGPKSRGLRGRSISSRPRPQQPRPTQPRLPRYLVNSGVPEATLRAQEREKPTTHRSPQPSCWIWLLWQLKGGPQRSLGKQPGAQP